MNREKIVVVGSSNTDMTVKSKSLPKPGETVLGGDFYMQQGGKGANQAVAVARLGGRAVFVGKVGEDAFGEASVAAYRADGIDTRHVTATRRAPSGVALIMVDQGAENCISVAPGANACLGPEDILAAQAEFEQAAIVLLQMEIPMPAIVQAVELGHASGARVILNPAPAQFVPDSVLSRLYMITPNRAEAEKLTGIKVTDMESAGRAARMLADKGIGRVVITLGGKGVFIRDAEVLHSGRAGRGGRYDGRGRHLQRSALRGAVRGADAVRRRAFRQPRGRHRRNPHGGADLHPVPERVESRIRIKP